MTNESYTVLNVILGGFAALNTLIAAYLVLLGASKDTHSETQKWFNYKWQAINGSKWLKMPELIIQWIFDAKEVLSKKFVKIIGLKVSSRVKWALYLTILFLWIGCYFKWGIFAVLISFILSIIFGLLIIEFIAKSEADRSVAIMMARLNQTKGPIVVSHSFGLYVLMFIINVFSIIIFWGAMYVWISFLLNLEIIFAAIFMFLLFPFFTAALFTPILYIETFLEAFKFKIIKIDDILIFGISISGSISTTLAFLLIGHFANPASFVPHSFQMLIANIVFDGLTIFATLKILQWAISKPIRKTSRIIIAICFDLIIAAVLACLSLYFALVLSEHTLSIEQTLFVLIARSPDGNNWEIGPYFWAMHTTFLPTLVYIFIIFICCLGKAILAVVGKYFRKAGGLKNPLNYTGAVFGVIAAIFGVLYWFFNAIFRIF